MDGKTIKSKQKVEEEKVEPTGIGDIIAMALGRLYHGATTDSEALKAGTPSASLIIIELQEYHEKIQQQKSSDREGVQES